MSDFDRSVQSLLERPPLAPTPVAELRARARRHRARRAAALTVAGIVVVALVATIASVGGGGDRSDSVVAARPAPRELVRTVIPLGVGATDVAVGEGDVWVPGSEVVRRVDPERNAVSAVIPVPGSSDYRSATVAFGAVWVTDTGTGMLTKIDGDLVVSTFIGSAPTKTVATTDRLWVVQGNGDHETLTPVDPSGLHLGAPIQLDDAREAFPGVAALGDVLYATYGPRVVRYDTTTGETSSSSEYVTRALAMLGDDVVAITDAYRLVVFDGITLEVLRMGPRIPAAQDVVSGSGVVWVLAQPSSVEPSRLWRVDPRTLAPMGKSVEAGLTSTGLAADGSRVWAANFSDGTLTRVDTQYRNPRPELCPGSVPLDRASPDGLPPVSSVTTDPAIAQQSLAAREARLRAQYPQAVDAGVGPGFGRAYEADDHGRVTVLAVDDYAIILTLRSRRDCPKLAQMPVAQYDADVPVFLAFAR